MSSTEIVTLIASIIALIGSIVSLFISTRLAIWKERRQLRWSKELERFFQLEELAGDLVEDLGGYRPLPEDRTELAGKFDTLGRAAGRFARYPEVRQAIWALRNTLDRMFVAKRDSEDDREIRGELDPAFRKLLEACDKALDRKRRSV
ncbi:MAG: hypothetical protein ABSF45_21635 [Terriglobia bacterium]|jgi:hypothetical protein